MTKVKKIMIATPSNRAKNQIIADRKRNKRMLKRQEID